ncbi:MAG: PTS IIA-like nitrogen regulatory protein PtsN [Alphaproteobacteria bacterium]|nr:PTS IIA-like nitrogen regulatory protein PtsN [Alphaproteobacteria bacterium]
MNITEIIDPSGILSNLKVSNKNQLLKELSRAALRLIPPDANGSERIIYDILLERERLGTTGLGNGIAVPHGKLPRLKKIICIFARLETPIDFEAIDDQAVDLIFLLLAPEGAGADHLKALALISRLLRDSATCEKLRGATSADALYAIIVDKAATAVRASR